MCIRDRCIIRLRRFAKPQHSLKRPVQGGGVAALLEIRAEPVSYTHLRAHETVLDLVCRLLLEKKNTVSQTLQAYLIIEEYKQSLTTENTIQHTLTVASP